jgi:hypothetical protein
VTRTTISTQLSLVGIILGVAGRTILGCRFHIVDAAGSSMTRWAVQWGMFPSELEGDLAVVEIMIISINPIMASQAILAISLQVNIHKVGINLLVAGNAYRVVKL